MDMWRAQSLLAEAIGLCPTMATLWSNRSRVFEQIHRYDEALSDAQEAIALAPEWPKGYLRAGRALLNLERYDESQQALRLALELAPGDKSIRDCLEQATWLVRAKTKEEESMARLKPNKDILGIRRAECRKKGCNCACYVQKQASNAVNLNGRYVRHDNNVVFLNCLRCGHPSYMHRDLRIIHDARPGPKGQRKKEEEARAKHMAKKNRPVPHTNQGAGTKGGLDSTYYYGAVPESDKVVKLPPHQRIDGDDDGRVDPNASENGYDPSGYYYAHNLPTDYKVPVVPKRMDAEGNQVAWDPEAEAAAAAAEAAALLIELREVGGNVEALQQLATREDERDDLTAQLKALGFTKLGKRKKVEQALIDLHLAELEQQAEGGDVCVPCVPCVPSADERAPGAEWELRVPSADERAAGADPDAPIIEDLGCDE